MYFFCVIIEWRGDFASVSKSNSKRVRILLFLKHGAPLKKRARDTEKNLYFSTIFASFEPVENRRAKRETE
jgi:hypothetical protein